MVRGVVGESEFAKYASCYGLRFFVAAHLGPRYPDPDRLVHDRAMMSIVCQSSLDSVQGDPIPRAR